MQRCAKTEVPASTAREVPPGEKAMERNLSSLCGWCSLAAVCSHEALDIGLLTLSWLAEPSASTSPLGPHAPG